MSQNVSLQRLDDRAIPNAPGEIRAFLVVRNEALRLADNLRHHRALGISRFFIVDNGSTDGTLDFLLAQPDVHLFSTQESFAASGFGISWINSLLDAHGDGHWTLTVDADELLIYPGFESVALPRVCAHLDHLQVEGLFCMLLDMYADGPLKDVGYRAGDSLIAACPWFDPAPYRTVQAAAFPHVQLYGGVRERIFQFAGSAAPNSPTLSKVPLVRWRAGMRFLLCTHSLTPIRLAQMTGALLHFKFLGDFHTRAMTEAARGEHFAGAIEYKIYVDLLGRDPALTLRDSNSVRLQASRQLVELGLMAI
jgi:glycosyltransferase involved in cell wall biosynthesis